MKDYLSDLVSHSHDLGCIDLIKITGTDKQTHISGMAEDRSVVLEGSFNNPVPEFIGTFGMPNLGKLKILLGLEEYKEKAKIAIKLRDSDKSPECINFENSHGDFKNSYRFMAPEIINAKLQTVKFKGVNWHVEFEPTVSSISRLKMQAQANAEELTFQIKTEGKDLKFFFGNHSSHAGDFVFQSSVTGQIKRSWSYPVQTFISILNLVGDKKVRFSDEGAAQITVNSGLAVYNYILPAQTK
jgi:hypothetical protein